MSRRPLGSGAPSSPGRALAGSFRLLDGLLPFGGLLPLLLAGAAVATLALPALGEGPLRAILALPLVLVVPGYALTLALMPQPRLGAGERLVHSLGLSLALAALGGFVLNWTPWGLRPQPWAALLALTTLGSGAVAWARRSPSTSQPVARVPVTTAPSGDAQRSRGRPALPALLLALATVVVGAAWWTARGGAAQQASAGFTQLWALPAPEGDALTVRLGVRSQEPAPVSYRLRLEVEGELIQEWPAVALAPGEQWEAVATLSPPQGAAGPVTALLYRADAPETAYRHVQLWRDRVEPAGVAPTGAEPGQMEPAQVEPGQEERVGEG